ncbi:hypothetical protein GURASL_37480 [Geotalea uraniireducens]|uniref:Uncharacterized protein n=1 Tax=Geotalea uraniireducens TaxID=351604 RepID=A0ABM8EQD0_9BACT|nr:hypothetical protein [Geotalea uraniireducens]BDV44825.1 hypothetical protein GURASL_37480 [Geotalea uraniireducens]
MELTLDEHKLIADFRRLGPAGKKELLDTVACLLKKDVAELPEESASPADRCALKKKADRPEAAEEPIFTE